jgi:hypothetical protein
MNFFVLEQKTLELLTSPKLWIYFVSSIGLTVLTMVLYYMMAGLPRIKKDPSKSDEFPSMNLKRGYTDVEKNL